MWCSVRIQHTFPRFRSYGMCCICWCVFPDVLMVCSAFFFWTKLPAWTACTLVDEGIVIFGSLETAYPLTQLHNPEYWNPQERHCEHVKFCSLCSLVVGLALLFNQRGWGTGQTVALLALCLWLLPGHSFVTLFTGFIKQLAKFVERTVPGLRRDEEKWPGMMNSSVRFCQKMSLHRIFAVWVNLQFGNGERSGCPHHEGSRCIARLIHPGIRWRWVVNFLLRLLYPGGKSLWYPLSRGWVGARTLPNVLERRNTSCLC